MNEKAFVGFRDRPQTSKTNSYPTNKFWHPGSAWLQLDRRISGIVLARRPIQ